MRYICLLFFILTAACSPPKGGTKGVKESMGTIGQYRQIKSLDLSLGTRVKTDGFYKEGDGGDAIYVIRKNGVHNGLSIIKIKNGFFAHLEETKQQGYNIRQFGARGNGDLRDREIFAQAIKLSKQLIIPKGIYQIKTGVYLPEGSRINGEDGAIIKGMFMLDGVRNISIRNLTFESWNQNQNYAVRIGSSGVQNLIIENCVFKKKSFIYQDLPKTKANTTSDIKILNCDFSFLHENENITINTIQLHTNNLEVKKCNFVVSGIDGCIKNSSGEGSLTIESCTFSGKLDEEILDFYTYNGNLYFKNNKIQLSAGAVIRTKPIKNRKELVLKEDVEYIIEGNVVENDGNPSDNLIYIAGYHNLVGGRELYKQKVQCSNNKIISSQSSSLFSFRGIDELDVSNNTLISDGAENKILIYFSSVRKLNLVGNILSGGRLFFYASSAPTGEKYKENIPRGEWLITQNKFSNIAKNKSAIYIHKQGLVNINLVENEFDFRKFNNKTIIEFSQGEYGNFNLKNNDILKPKEHKSGAKETIVKWGKATHSARLMDSNNIK